MPQLFTTAIICSPLDDDSLYLDRWCYHSVTASLEAFEEWDATEYAINYTSVFSPRPNPVSEPMGWHRHPPTARRRENGDPAKEEIRP